MILTITIDTSGPEFCCGRTPNQIGYLLGLASHKLGSWKGDVEFSTPLETFTGRIVGRITAAKVVVEGATKPA